ncbi:hypothetical protein QF012_004740 [Pseudomonas laurylsulfatiphila]
MQPECRPQAHLALTLYSPAVSVHNGFDHRQFQPHAIDTLGGRTAPGSLTGRDGESDIVQALNAGADDYVSKPFRPNEKPVLARSCADMASSARPPKG